MDKKGLKKFYSSIALIVGLSVIMSGCSLLIGNRNSTSIKKMTASFTLFTGIKDRYFDLERGDEILFDYKISQKSGGVRARFVDSSGNEVAVFGPNTSGKKSIHITHTDRYRFIVESTEAKGSYEFRINIEGDTKGRVL